MRIFRNWEGKRGSSREEISDISHQISGGKRKAKRDDNTEFTEAGTQRSQRKESKSGANRLAVWKSVRAEGLSHSLGI